MKSTDFAKCLSNYLSIYLPVRKNVSENTIKSYRDTFKLFLTYCQDAVGIKVERVGFCDIDLKLIENFLDWLAAERQCTVSSCNQRLAALRSFFRYAQIEAPEYIAHIQGILSIPMKKTASIPVNYLTTECVRLLLTQPNTATSSGRRDLALLSLLYDTGARVQELVDLSIKDLRLEHPAKVRLYGKGRKIRDVPLMENTVSLLRIYLSELKDSGYASGDTPLFRNRSDKRITRAGVSYILNKYFDKTKPQMAGLPDSISPHAMRHSKAMHLLQAGINIFYIKDLLGHADISTTEIYAHADIEMKRAALMAVDVPLVPKSVPAWAKDEELLSWLSRL